MIKSQIDLLSGKSMEQLNALLKDMNNILVHNQKLYTDIELESINTEFSCRKDI